MAKCPACEGRGWSPIRITVVRMAEMTNCEVREYCSTCSGRGELLTEEFEIPRGSYAIALDVMNQWIDGVGENCKASDFRAWLKNKLS